MPALISEFHEGERAMHKLLKVPRQDNPTAPGLPMRYGVRVMHSSLVALGTMDGAGRAWTTIWGGERGFARPVAENVLALNSVVDTRHDAVFQALWEGADPTDEGVVVRPGGGKPMAGLAIDLQTRDRVKLAGNMVAGAVVDGGKGRGGVQLAMAVTESLGNCPKYLNKKDVVPHEMKPELVSLDGLLLPEEAVDLIARADMFFLSSTNGEVMDTNHRGGNRGFVRVVENTDTSLELVYPEFSGNRLYQTLGNLKVNPKMGMAIPNFDTADVLYLTGTASVLVGEDASSLLARSQLVVKMTVTSARFVKSGLPFRGAAGEPSPYNPPVRHLVREHDAHLAATEMSGPGLSASLVRRERLTPTIHRYTFQLSTHDGGADMPEWRAGQYVTLDFQPELGAGYSHMRDDDPQSLNDDLIRTFTVSSPPTRTGEMQLTVRTHGPTTKFLARHNPRAGLDIPVLGFGGEDGFRMSPDPEKRPVFVAAGVGITPLLAQAPGLLREGVPLRVLWSLRQEDLGLARDAFARVRGLAGATTLFVTGGEKNGEGQDERGAVEGLGAAKVEMRRMGRGDVEGLKEKGNDHQGARSKFFLCTGPALLAALGEWLAGEEVVWEDFGY